MLGGVPAEAEELGSDPQPDQLGVLLLLGDVLLGVVELAHCGKILID